MEIIKNNVVIHVALGVGEKLISTTSPVVLYQGESFKESVQKLNEQFVSLKKDGEDVRRIGISKFFHHKKENR